jgi:serine/threonine-protein kinase
MPDDKTSRIGPYEIEERLGDAFLYRARDTRSGDAIAIKVLPAWQRTAESLARFEREVKVEREIRHENLARFLDLGKERVHDPDLVGSAADPDGTGEVFFFVREWVEGQPLDDRLESGPLEPWRALAVGQQIARGLAALHEHEVVHRNLSPRNVVIEPGGTVKLVDFGLVKLLKDRASRDAGFQTAAGKMLGTAGYMAPEQLQGGDIDGRCDLFALGVVLYEAISGERPFPTDNLLAFIEAIQNDEPQPLYELVSGVPVAASALIARLLAKEPSERPQSAAEVVAKLEEVLAQRPTD